MKVMPECKVTSVLTECVEAGYDTKPLFAFCIPINVETIPEDAKANFNVLKNALVSD